MFDAYLNNKFTQNSQLCLCHFPPPPPPPPKNKKNEKQ